MTMPPEGADRAGAIAGRLAVVRERIADAARAAGRRPDDVRLVAVSKFQPLELIAAALAAGQLTFGESRAQELDAKLGAADGGARWHFVGRLQRNKVPLVAGRVELIHSVDRAAVARSIDAHMRALRRRQDVLVQVNVTGEERKGGCAPDELADLLAAASRMSGVHVTGLMTIPPLQADPAPVFARLRELRDEMAREHADLVELSMGMSGDLEAAVAAGATIVRVGTAIFGPRPDDH